MYTEMYMNFHMSLTFKHSRRMPRFVDFLVSWGYFKGFTLVGGVSGSSQNNHSNFACYVTLYEYMLT